MQANLQLGQTVNYIRHDAKENSFEQGTGVVKAIFVDPNKRAAVQVKTADGVYNLAAACVGFEDPKFPLHFKAVTAKVLALMEEAKVKQQAVVDDYNAQILALEEPVFGAAIVLDDLAIANTPDHSDQEAESLDEDEAA